MVKGWELEEARKASINGLEEHGTLLRTVMTDGMATCSGHADEDGGGDGGEC